MNAFYDKNLYEILNIKEDATSEEIKIAYRQLARIYHPDINESEESLAKFKEIKQAYEILSNEKTKNLYDMKNGFNQIKEDDIQQNIEENQQEQAAEEEKEIKKENKKTITQILSEIFDGIFVYKKNSSQNKDKTNNEDIFANVTISAKEALLGTNRIINVMQTKICPNCGGNKFINEALCPLCKGSGEISNHKKLNVKIPANTKNGDKIKVPNAGNPVNNTENNGDLYLVITVDEKSLFAIKDDIIYMDLPILPYEAVLGAEIIIPTIYEDITIKIPPNTSSGQRFRLKGQGIFLKEKGCNGDMIVTVFIKVPQQVSEKEMELYNQLKEINTCNIREGLKSEE